MKRVLKTIMLVGIIIITNVGSYRIFINNLKIIDVQKNTVTIEDSTGNINIYNYSR